MIRMPPAQAKPSLASAARTAVFWPLGAAGGVFAYSMGSGRSDFPALAPSDASAVAGHLIVAGITLLPFSVALLARAAPGLTAPWGAGDDLFFKATRASLFFAGFVLIYMIVNTVMTGALPTGWKVAAAISAAIVLGWYGLLSIGPWSRTAGGRGDA